jgi:gliding motility-associated-like protein
MKEIFLTTLTLFAAVRISAQTDIVGSGRALKFDGIDDYIDLGNIYDDLTLPFTVSAWVYVDPTSTIAGPVLVTQDNNPIYNGFWFVINPTTVGIEYGDGKGDNHPSFRRGRSAYVPNLRGRWLHVCAVMKAASDIDIYVNGINMAGDYGGGSIYPMASMFPLDVAKIGYFLSNGVTYRFKGVMDELRLYNRALSQTEIQANMCRRVTSSEAGLIGYWNFDETSGDVLKDVSVNHFDGQLKGDPVRVFSGAPVGDESKFVYTSNWSSTSLTFNDLSVLNISPTAAGVQIYKVDKIPSRTNGLETAASQKPYYGIFLATNNTEDKFDLALANGAVCESYQRPDNSISSWSKTEILSDIKQRVELILTSGPGDLEVDLGADVSLCDQSSFFIQAHDTPADKTFLWSTGEITPSITVTATGLYSVEVKEGCKIEHDSIQVIFMTSPPAFSLGENEASCQFDGRILKPDVQTDGVEFTWQDGSTNESFAASDYGTYWLTLENSCGASSDSIVFSQAIFDPLKIPNVITPNNYDEKNQYFILDNILLGSQLNVFNRWGKPVFQSSSYQNNWDGGRLPSGIYYYTLHGGCIEELKGSITILR